MHIIHPTAKIHPLAYLDPTTNITVHAGAEIGAFTVVGTRGEFRREGEKNGNVIIGKNTVIREQCTIQISIEGNATYIGEDCYIMNKSHIANDVIIEDNTTISTGSLIGGYCKIGKSVNLGLGAIIHQRLEIGNGVMVGMGSVITKNVPPYLTIAGSPAKIMGINQRGMERAGLDTDKISNLQENLNMTLKLSGNYMENEYANNMANFIKNYDKVLTEMIK